MGWILLEVMVALLLAVLIVWFTLGARRDEPPGDASTPAERDKESG
jgi:hypothetical protein